MIERKLQDTEILIEQGWRATAYDMLIDESWRDWIDGCSLEGIGLADLVITDRMSVFELKAHTGWARSLDAQASRQLGNIFDQALDLEDRAEATARRIAHHAGRSALRKVGSENRREDYRARNWARLARAESMVEDALAKHIDVFDITRIQIVR